MHNPKVFIKSFGCQMNVYDSARMADSLGGEGYCETSDINAADLIILNTCHIRERASEKIYSELGRLKEQKIVRAARGQATMIAVAGCVAQADGVEIIRRQPAVDIVIGTQSYHRLPDAVRLAQEKPGVVFTDFAVEDKFDHLHAPSTASIKSRGVTAFVTVQEGCDKFCSFCVVPYTRGIETSRPIAKIIDEIERLTAAGVCEVTLLGQNVNAYHGVDEKGRETSLVQLIERIARMPGIKRIRYTTSHPTDMSNELVEAHQDIPALMPFIHLPVQSGSDSILKAMNRKHRVREYLDIIERLRKARPDIAISSDFIVGFPGERQSDFEATLTLVREVGFSGSFSFKFSSRPGTPAETLGDQVDEMTKAERLAQLQHLLEEQRQSFNRSLLGETVDVLFEKPGRYEKQIIGKSPYMQAVFAEGAHEMIGSLQSVEIIELSTNSLRGRILSVSRQ